MTPKWKLFTSNISDLTIGEHVELLRLKNTVRPLNKAELDEIKAQVPDPAKRAEIYRKIGQSPSGVIDGVYNDFYCPSDRAYNDFYRDWDANA